MEEKNKSNKYKKHILIISTIFVISLTTIAIIAHVSYKKISSKVNVETIYKNIFVNEIDIGGLSKENAAKKITETLQTPLDKKIITLKDGNKNEYRFSFKDFNAIYNVDDAVQKAYDYARNGSLIGRYEKISKLKDSPLKIKADYNINKDFIRSKLSELESKVYVKPKNASAYRKNNSLVTVDGSLGKKLNLDKTLPYLLKLLEDQDEGTVNLIFDIIKPQYGRSSFDNVKDILGSYRTSFSRTDINRNTNIINAANKINNNVVFPNEIFSTNATLKPFTVQNGYKNAPVIVSGKIVDALGGGICQVSTALYNALLFSELQVTERRNHSLKVGYIDYGYDATLAGDYIDLKFKNTTSSPILIESTVSANSLTVNIYGHETRDKSHKIKFVNELVETIAAPAETVIYTKDLPDGVKKFESKSKKGYKYKVYKIVTQNQKQTEKTLINTSYYRPVRGIVKIGTGK